MKSAAEEAFATQLQSLGIKGWEREFRFHPSRKWRFDFAWPRVRVAIEIEGGSFAGGKRCPACKQVPMGRHHSVGGHAEDMVKYNAAACAGWKVLRFPTKLIKTYEAAAQTMDLLVSLGAHTPPNKPHAPEQPPPLSRLGDISW